MKKRHTQVWIATVLSGLVLAGLLLMFGLGLFDGNKPEPTVLPPDGAVTATPAQAGETTPAGTLTPQATPTPAGAVTPDATPAQTGSLTPEVTEAPTLTATPTPGGKDNSDVVNPQLETAVYCLDVGEGSSTLFCSGTTAVLIDGGDAYTSSYVISFLKRLGIKRLQLVVATHYDSDHISGLVGALSAFAVDEVWGPAYEGDTKTYASFASMIRSRDVPWTYPGDGRTFSADGVTVTVLASSVPGTARQSGDAADDDAGMGDPSETGEDTSLALRVTLDNVSILVMGDAGAARERALVKKGDVGKCDIFLVNHHGSRYSNTSELLGAARPKYAVISVGENDYGHPAKECIDRIVECGALIYRTDVQGTVIFSVEGDVIRPYAAALEDPYQKDDSGIKSAEELPEGVTYILNGNTMKYHLPDCSSVAGQMHRNWYYFYGTAEAAEDMGYQPCGNCLGKH
ncbi:MAG: MBL fold metallo-hydrolase [Lachnospiraceae bacterium]|nr:MBL fold metallo-hydrolase [Lachnospiraceae bacterium]